MAAHDHDHEHEHAPAPVGVPVDEEETAQLSALAVIKRGTAEGYFLTKAANSSIQYERAYWMRRVDGARYNAARKRSKQKLTRRAQENIEAEERLFGTEATLEIIRIVGNAVVLKMNRGESRAGGYSLVGKISGQKGQTGHGAPHYPSHWVIQNLDMGTVYEFAVVSEDDQTAKEVMGPWLSVPIGNVSTEAIQTAEKTKAAQEYQDREELEAELERQHKEKVAKRRQERQEQLDLQREESKKDRERRERERIRREEIHKKAVKELPLVGPREMELRLNDRKGPFIDLEITFKRGKKAPQIYQFKLNGTVLGYYPDGRHSGRKRADHVYRRTVQVPRGQKTTLHVYGVTEHGDGGEPITIDVPKSLCEDEETSSSRMDNIIAAVRSFSGRRTRDGRPHLSDLRWDSGIKDITSKERNEAHKNA